MNMLDPSPIDHDNLQAELAVCGVSILNGKYLRFNECGQPSTHRVCIRYHADPDNPFYYYTCTDLMKMIQGDAERYDDMKVEVAPYAHDC